MKPCHVLRELRTITKRLDTFETVQSLLADKIVHLPTSWKFLEEVSEDVTSLTSKIDNITNVIEGLSIASNTVLEKTHSLYLRTQNMSNSMDDIFALLSNESSHTVLSGNDNNATLLPIIEDVRRSLKRVVGDIGSWSSAVADNSRLINTIATDVRNLTPSNHQAALTNLEDHDEWPALAPGPSTPEQLALSSVPASTHADEHPTKDAEHSAVSEPSSPGQPLPSIHVDASICVDEQPPKASSLPSKAFLSRKQRKNAKGRRVLNNPSVATTSVLATDESPACVTQYEQYSPTPILKAASVPKSIFISRLDPETKESEVIQYITHYSSIPHDLISCKKLSSRAHNGSTPLVSSFRILVPEQYFPNVVNPGFWPDNLLVKEFVPHQKHRPQSQKLQKNESRRLPSTTPT